MREAPAPAAGAARAGRPGVGLELNPEAAVFIGAEIGVEHITTLQMDLAGRIIHCRVEPFDGRAVSAEAAVIRAAAQGLDDVPEAKAELVEGFGLAAPAQIDDDGIVSIAPILGWRDEDLTDLLQTELGPGMPVMIENDANAFAFGDSYHQPEARAGVTLFLVIETGVGGGIVIGGNLFRGGHGRAGEIGHLILRDDTEAEELLGLDNILRQYAGAKGLQEPTLGGFLGAVQGKDPAAMLIAEAWARDLARMIAGACRMIDPDRVVLGGSLAALYPPVAGTVRKFIREFQASFFPAPEILLHEAAESGAAYGAACMLHQRFLAYQGESPASGDGHQKTGQKR